MKIVVHHQHWLKLYACLFGLFSIILALLGCQAKPEATLILPTEPPNPPTPTPVPPTETPAPPTATPAPPTATPVPNPWQRKADLLLPVVGAAASAINGKIYLISGAAEVGEETSDEAGNLRPSTIPVEIVQVYDPATDSWSQVADIPTPRFYLSTAVVEGKIYAFGGSPQADYYSALAAVEVYDPATDTWETRPDMPTPRTVLGSHTIDGKVYIFGGDLECHCKVDVYDPETDEWEARTDMPTPRDRGASAMVDGKVYLFGGMSRQGWISVVDVYDPLTDTWSQVADIPTPRYGLSGCALDGKIYAVSGIERDFTNYTTAVDVYDTVTGDWKATGLWPGALDDVIREGFPTPGQDMTVSSVSDRIFVFGGRGHFEHLFDIGNVWEYDTDF